MSLMHLGFIFVCGLKLGSNVILFIFYRRNQLSQNKWLKKASFPRWFAMVSLSYIRFPNTWGSNPKHPWVPLVFLSILAQIHTILFIIIL